MRNLLLVILLFFAGFFAINAQKKEMSWGVKGGVTITDLVNSDIYGGETKVGWTAGLVYEIHLTDRFSIQPEVLYSRQGAKSNYTTPYGGDENVMNEIYTNITLHYINIPVYAKYYIVDGFNVFLGPQFAILADNEIETKETIPLIPNPQVIRERDKLNRSKSFGIDGSVGLGYHFDFDVFVQAVYSYGFYKIVAEDDMKNSVLQFSVGYKF
ncbi:porin family protein [Aureivirga marina]|uniref:porin family protein n=1 Tax=Aureivirga marina TaxID=1182451 RepID=UPI0018CB9119|nr:porin family protein [Aureivirga marina]